MPETESHKKINWKSILIGITIGAVSIGLGVTIYLLLQPKPTEPTTTGTSKKATPSAKISTPSAKKDETADWKIYVNEEIGFSIKFPSGFNVDEIPGAPVIYKSEKLDLPHPTIRIQ